MRIMISDNIIGIDPEKFVIKVFDAIKCAAGTGNALDIKNVNWVEINEYK